MPSILRGFSAPVKLVHEPALTDDTLAFLAAHDPRRGIYVFLHSNQRPRDTYSTVVLCVQLYALSSYPLYSRAVL